MTCATLDSPQLSCRCSAFRAWTQPCCASSARGSPRGCQTSEQTGSTWQLQIAISACWLRASFIIPQNCTAVHNRHLDKLQEPEKRKIRTVLLYFCTLYFCRCFFFMNLHLYIFPHRDGLGTLVALVTGTPKNVGFAALPFGSSCSIGTWGQ